MTDVTMPQLGETVTEGTITKWFKAVGESVAEDEVLFEVSTDKVDSEVPSPTSGTLVEILVPEGETVDVGTRLAVLGDAASSPPGGAGADEAPQQQADEAPPEPAPAPPPTAAPAAPSPPTAAPAAPAPAPAPAPRIAPEDRPATPGPVLSPVVRRLIAEHGLDPVTIAGSGPGGRITRTDVQKAVEGGAGGRGPGARVPTAPAPTLRTGEDAVVPLNNIRRRTGEHMVHSKQVSPHVVTVVEIDYEGVERVRRTHGEQWRAEEGFSLTYLPFIARAVIDALHDFPHLNATVGDGELVVHGHINLAVAVDLDFEGLLAPVVRDADQKRLRPIAREIRDLADRAHLRQLTADEITGGTFTLTNAGSFGTHLQLPIINQPQVAILSTDGVRRKPVVVTDGDGSEAIAIHSVGMLPLTWDHRAFDGAYAAAFLARIREIIETREWEAEL